VEVGLPEDDPVKPPNGLRFPFRGTFQIVLLNQAFRFFTPTYPDPKPSGGSREKEFLEDADMKPSRKSFSLFLGFLSFWQH